VLGVGLAFITFLERRPSAGGWLLDVAFAGRAAGRHVRVSSTTCSTTCASIVRPSLYDFATPFHLFEYRRQGAPLWASDNFRTTARPLVYIRPEPTTPHIISASRGSAKVQDIFDEGGGGQLRTSAGYDYAAASLRIRRFKPSYHHYLRTECAKNTIARRNRNQVAFSGAHLAPGNTLNGGQLFPSPPERVCLRRTPCRVPVRIKEEEREHRAPTIYNISATFSWRRAVCGGGPSIWADRNSLAALGHRHHLGQTAQRLSSPGPGGSRIKAPGSSISHKRGAAPLRGAPSFGRIAAGTSSSISGSRGDFTITDGTDNEVYFLQTIENIDTTWRGTGHSGRARKPSRAITHYHLI